MPDLLLSSIIFDNLEKFVLRIAELEIYYSFNKKALKVSDSSVALGCLIQITNKQLGAESYYTHDYNNYKESNLRLGRNNIRKSVGIIYDKKEKEPQDNHRSHDDIKNDAFDTRLEMRLNNVNCNLLSLDNIEGNEYEIINRYYNYLAIQFKKYFLGHVEIDEKENMSLEKLVSRAEKLTAKRYTGKELKRTEPLGKEFLRPNKITKKEKKKRNQPIDYQ